jgi:hypothetical protein
MSLDTSRAARNRKWSPAQFSAVTSTQQLRVQVSVLQIAGQDFVTVGAKEEEEK